VPGPQGSPAGAGAIASRGHSGGSALGVGEVPPGHNGPRALSVAEYRAELQPPSVVDVARCTTPQPEGVVGHSGEGGGFSLVDAPNSGGHGHRNL